MKCSAPSTIALVGIRLAVYALVAAAVVLNVVILPAWWYNGISSEADYLSLEVGDAELTTFRNEVITYTAGIAVVVAMLGGLYEYLWKRREFARAVSSKNSEAEATRAPWSSKLHCLLGYQLKPLGRFSP